ncbi:hypothetical protein C0584_05495 [Candidatus Parcubacteria bacterium]|nr:MAG: hypothetical protein C0584_05495 [Candidatus Parcubacteria bacterium]
MFDDLDINEKPTEDQGEKLSLNNPEQKPIMPEKKPGNVSNNEVEDIFSSGGEEMTEDSSESTLSINEGKEKPDAFKPIEGDRPREVVQQEDAAGSFISKLIKFVIVLLIILAIGVGAYFAYDLYLKDKMITNDYEQTEQADLNSQEEDLEAKVEEVQEIKTEPVQEEVIQERTVTPSESNLDTDGDGLSDAREMELGTRVDNIDTDGDGLFDREEVEVYKTNPKNADTDGDSFSDGSEVQAGYNPNGAGKLYEIGQ